MAAPDVRGPAAAAFALRTPATGSAASAAIAPPARPDRRRKLRRSRPLAGADNPAAIDPRVADAKGCCVLLISTVASSTRITIDAVERLDVVAFPVARLALLIVALTVGQRRAHQGRSERCARADRAETDLAKEVAAADGRFLLVSHGISPGPAVRLSWQTRKPQMQFLEKHVQAFRPTGRNVSARFRPRGAKRPIAFV